MWDRKELKARGKAAFKANYWLSVIVAFILALVTGGGAGILAGSSGGSINFNYHTDIPDDVTGGNFLPSGDDIGAAFNGFKETLTAPENAGVAMAILGVVLAVIAVAVVISVLVDILLLNPVEVSCQNFFIQNSQGSGELNNLERGFKPSWGNNVKTMFLRDLFLFLWGLLLLIPAIIKGYAYRMVPYILADHPELSGKEVITLSRQMMNGHKWRTFVMDLSFIGWYLLSLLTLGILGIFYVHPYKKCTDAELYQTLKEQVSF